jgi:predicted AAA+ superfamily ATPase
VEPWYKVVQPREEVREGRSFNPDEFAIALEQVVAGTAPSDYTNPVNFFARTCFTKALHEHVSMVLRRLNGETVNAAPVLTLITQFGGGKTHTLAALYHAVKNVPSLDRSIQGDLLRELQLDRLPSSRVAVFMGNAWDPPDTRENPWIEGEISEVLRRRLFDDLGKESVRRSVALAYTNWCFENRAQFPTDVTAVGSAATEQKAREYLRGRFEACYPFHLRALFAFFCRTKNPRFRTKAAGVLLCFHRAIRNG